MASTLPPKGAPCKGLTRRARNTVAARRYRARHRAAYNARARERQRRQREARRAALSRSAQDVLQPKAAEAPPVAEAAPKLVELPPVFRPALSELNPVKAIHLPSPNPRALAIARGRRRARQAWAERTVALSPLRAELLSEVAA